MNIYSIDLTDQAKPSWALHEVVKQSPDRPRPEGLAPVFYKFFPSQKAEVRMKPQYWRLCCKKCGRYDAEKMFAVGFDDPVTIEFREDYGHTRDRIFSISDKLLKALKKAKVGGFETKPLGKSDWHAMNVTLRVDHSDKVVKRRKPLCSECGRPAEAFGIFKNISELSVPDKTNTFFTTKGTWCRFSSDRDIFITEDVLQTLRDAGIVGGYCTRLLTNEELAITKQKSKQGIDWAPPGSSVHLNGKRSKK